MFKFITQFFRDEEGASAVEYGLVIGLIAVVLITVLTVIGVGESGTGGLQGLFQSVADAITDVNESGTTE